MRQEHTYARLRLAKAGLEYLENVAETESAPEFVVEQLRQSWKDRGGSGVVGSLPVVGRVDMR